MAKVTDNNQPKVAVEEMAARMATVTVTMMTLARTMTAETAMLNSRASFVVNVKDINQL